MVNTVGRVDFRARLDGRGTERDAENIGNAAGRAAGEGLDKEFSKSFRKTLSDSGKRSFDAWQKSGMDDGGIYGKTFTDRLVKVTEDGLRALRGIRLDAGFLDDYAKGYKDVDSAVADLTLQLDALNGRVNGNSLNAAKRQVDEWAASTRQAEAATEALNVEMARQAEETANATREADEHTRARDNLIRSIREHNQVALQNDSIWREQTSSADGLNRRVAALADSTSTLSFHWKDLSHNTRQWTLIIGAIAAGMQDIAVLGSAAGAGLVAVGGAATSGIIGLAGTAAVFVTLNKELEDLPEHLRPVAAEFKRFTPVFSELREAVASGAFQRMPGVFDQLGDSLRSLTPALDTLGRSIGDTFGDLARSTKPGSEALEEIRRSIELAGPNFRSLAGAAGTLGVALLRAFNEAQPLVQGLIDYVQELADRFDAFTQSGNFDMWMANAERIFSSLGPLIDSVGRALNDLVTPAAVERTAAFIDNLTGFMPNLTQMLDILGKFDAFGLAAQLLNDFGVALEPLAGPVGDLAEALNGVLSVAISTLAEALGQVAIVIAPTVQGVADFIAAIPPDVLAGIATGVLVVAAAFVTLKGAAGIAGLVTSLSGLGAMFDTTAGKAGKAGNAIGGALGKAGIVGLAIAGVTVLSGALEGLHREFTGIDDTTRNLVAGNASLGDAYKQLGGSVFGVLTPLTDIDTALDNLAGSGAVGTIGTIGNAFKEGGSQANALTQTLWELSPVIAQLAMQDLPAAQKQFAGWATELGASDAQVMNMLNTMPEFKQALIDQAGVLNIAATDQNLLNLALGESVGASAAATSAFEGIGASALGASVEIEGLSDRIRNFGDAQISTIEATSAFEGAIDELTASITTNGSTLDLNTEAGRTNTASLLEAIQGAKDHSAAVYDETGNIELANETLATQKQRLIDTIRELDNAGYEAGLYTEVLNTIPDTVLTEAELAGIAAAEAALARLTETRTVYINAVIANSASNDFYANGGVNRPGFASGGTLYGPTHILAGEAGPEAIVPLNRPLSQVDPTVRWLSAIAQGKATPAMASGGIVGGGAVVNFEPGSIVVYETGDARRTANEVASEVIARVRS